LNRLIWIEIEATRQVLASGRRADLKRQHQRDPAGRRAYQGSAPADRQRVVAKGFTMAFGLANPRYRKLERSPVQWRRLGLPNDQALTRGFNNRAISDELQRPIFFYPDD
jgi:hypothetical protein